MNKKKILVADDNISLLKPIAILLARADYAVETIADGLTVVPQMEKVCPDLLLLDVSMPGTDGRDICMELKKNMQVKHIPIILMTAHHDLKNMAIRAGADDYISKPFNISDLLHKISKHLDCPQPDSEKAEGKMY